MSVETVQMVNADVQNVALHTDTFMQSITPLIHCSVNNVLIEATPLFNLSFFQTIDVADLATVEFLLESPPNRDDDRNKVIVSFRLEV